MLSIVASNIFMDILDKIILKHSFVVVVFLF